MRSSTVSNVQKEKRKRDTNNIFFLLFASSQIAPVGFFPKDHHQQRKWGAFPLSCCEREKERPIPTGNLEFEQNIIQNVYHDHMTYSHATRRVKFHEYIVGRRSTAEQGKYILVWKEPVLSCIFLRWLWRSRWVIDIWDMCSQYLHPLNSLRMATVIAIGEIGKYIATSHICSSKRSKLCSLIEKELFRPIYALIYHFGVSLENAWSC